MNREIIGALVLAGAIALGSDQAFSQRLTWDLSNEYPGNSLHGETANLFATTLEALSGGEIVITRHHLSSLGYKSTDHFDAVGDGALELATSLVGTWGGIDPLFLLSSLPFLTPAPEDAQNLYAASRETYMEVMTASNQVLLVATPWLSSGIWANKPADSIEALQNLRIRTYDANGTITLRAIGAAPIQLSWADLVPQLSTGGVEAVLTSTEAAAQISLWDYQSHFSEVNYAYPLQFLHMNKDTYDALTDEQREWVWQAAATAEAYGWEVLPDLISRNYETMRSHGVTIIEDLDPAYLQVLSEAGQEAIDDWEERLGDRGTEILDRFRASAGQ